MGELSPWHWAVVILVLVLLFGAKRLPEAARGLGRSARILKAELHHTEPEGATPQSSATQPAPTSTPNPAANRDPEPSTAPAIADPMITTSQTSPRHD